MKNVEDVYVVSPMQQGLIFESLYAPESGAYFVQAVCDLKGELDIAAFRRAWQGVIDRQTILRTFFVWEDMDEILQVVNREVELPWQEHDWRGLPEGEQQARLEAFLNEDRARGFDLSRAPLMRVALVRLEDRNYKLVWSHHHLLIDGWSSFLVFREVFDLYEAFAAGQPVRLAPAPRYRDYIGWVQKQDKVEADRFWSRMLKGFNNPTPLPKTSLPHAATGGETRPGSQKIYLPAATMGALKFLARRYQLTPNTLVQGAWALVLSHYSGRDDIVFGTVVSGRPTALSGVEQMVGPFINLLPFRVKVDGERELLLWLKEIQELQAEMRMYEYSPLAHVQALSDVPRGEPLFESIMAFDNYPIDTSFAGEEDGLRVTDITSLEKTHYPLNFVVAPGDELLMQLNYDAAQFDERLVERMLGHTRTLLEAMIANPQQRLSQLSLLSEAERHQLLVEWNETRSVYPQDRCLQQIFEEQVARTPAAIAVSYGDERLSYTELNERANQLAHHLRDFGVGPEVLVGVCAERGVEMIVGLLGILKAGGVYVPLDPAYPEERLSLMLADAQPLVILTQERLEDLLPDYTAIVINLDADWETISQQSTQNLVNLNDAENLAYVIYTSGSTGRPKGVCITHRAINRLVLNTNYIELAQSDRVAQAANASFDAAIFEVWCALLNGAHLVGIAKEVALSPQDLAAQLDKSGITTLFLTTALFNQFAGAEPEACASLRNLLFGGEAADPRRVREVLRNGAPERLVNLYGPAENTTLASWHLVREVAEEARTVPIGHPVSNTQLFVLDRQMEPVAIGVTGELYVGGDGLARGYLHRPELTAERFIPHPYSEVAGARLYQTGDLVRYLMDGSIEFIGRNDSQVKIRGFRIEPGEIESMLLQHEGVHEAVVIVYEDAPGEKRLVAYCALKDASTLTPGDLRSYLKTRTPDYMIPSAFVMMESIPLTPNGKLDRSALPSPDTARPLSGHSFTPPQSPAEKVLAEVWSQVLGIEEVGVNDNFFELGGDSILSIQIIARANSRGLHLTPRQLFDYPTISELAAMSSGESETEAEQGRVSGEVPLTPIQQWFFENNLREPHHFNMTVLFATRADCRLEQLEEALKEVYEQHDGLRLRFQETDEGWRQHHCETDHLSLERIDLTHLKTEEQRGAIEREAEAAQASLNLSEGPLVRALHFDLGEGEAGRLLLVVHHLVVDGVSWRILLEDVERAYGQVGRGEKVELGRKSSSYKQWALALAEYAQSAAAREELAYWSGQEWASAERLKCDDSNGENIVSSARNVERKLSCEETRSLLQEVPEVYHTQINEVLLTALGRALGAWHGEGSVVVDMEGHGREEVVEGIDLSRTVGWFTSIYPLLLTVSGGEEVGNALKRVKGEVRRIPQRGIGYGVLKYLSEDAEVRRRMAEIPDGEVSFNYLGQFDQVLESGGVLAAAAESVGPSQSEADKLHHLLSFNGRVAGGQLSMVWSFSENVYSPLTVERLAESYTGALREIITHCRAEHEMRGQTSRATEGRPRHDRRASYNNKAEKHSYPLTSMQEIMATQSLATPGAGIYMPQLSLHINGLLKPATFRRAWEHVIQRHSVFSTSLFRDEQGRAFQVSSEQWSLPFDEQDWGDVAPDEQQQRLQALLSEDRRRGFDLSQAPLMRLALIRLSEGAYNFIWTHHHLLLDGWSAAMLLKEVFACYEAFERGEDLQFEESRPFSNYLSWLQRQDASEADSFWRKLLRGFTAPTPLPFRRTNFTRGQRGDQERTLSRTSSDNLRRFARQHHLTLNTIMQGAWALVLHQFSGHDDVVFGSVVSGRPAGLAGVEEIIGLFINTLPVRVQVKGEARVGEWLRALQTQQAEMRHHEHSPLKQVRQLSDVADGAPLFESILRFQNYPLDPSLQQPEAERSLNGLRTVDWWHYPLCLIVNMGASLGLHISYDSDQFESGEIYDVLERLQELLESFAASSPGQSLEQLMLAARSGWTGASFNLPVEEFPAEQR